MKQLLNTLFVTSEDIYLSLEGENVLANRDREVVARYPLHTLQTIVSFSYSGASPALMGACAEKGKRKESVWHSVRQEESFWHASAGKATETSCCAGNNTGSRTTHRKAAQLPET